MPQDTNLILGTNHNLEMASAGARSTPTPARRPDNGRGFNGTDDTGSTVLGERGYPAKTVIVQEGMSLQDILVLEEGWAIGYRLLPDGNRRIILFYLPGDLLTPSALFYDQSPNSVQALTPIRISQRDRGGFRRPDLENQGSGASPANLIGASFEALQDRVVGLGARSGIEAAAALFLDLYHRLRRRDEISGNSFWCPITQGHIADALGLTKVHVSRTVTALRQKGLLDFNKQRVELLDYDGLCHLTGFDPREES